jgi:hypothetical protein
MLTEPAPTPVPAEPADPLDVMVLVVPENASPARILDVIAQASTRDHTAILVVLPRGTDSQTLRRITAAGANHCAIAPAASDLFAHMQQARADPRHRRIDHLRADHGRADPRLDGRSSDELLDALWRSRAASR